MDDEECLAVDVICSLKNGSLANTALPNADKKIKKQKKSYYVKKKIRDKNLPLFPLKAPRNFHLMPTADPRTDYPRLVIETLAADADKFEALMKKIGAPDLLAVFQHHVGEQNPLGPNYREVLGLQNFIDFYLAVVHAVPDLVLTIIKDSVKCSRDPYTNEAFIVFKVVSLGTQVMFIQEKAPGEEERELAEMMNPPVHDPSTSYTTINHSSKSEHISSNNTGMSVEQVAVNPPAQALLNANIFSTYNKTDVNARIVGPTDRAIKLSRGNHSAAHAQSHSYINSTSNSNINSYSSDYINSINSTINSTYAAADLDKSSSEDHSSIRGSTHGSTHSSTHSDKIDSPIDIDNLVSNFNSFKLEPVVNRPLTTVYHYGTYVIVTDGNYKITKWLNFFKQTVGQAPAFPGMGTGVRDDIYVGGGGGNKTK